MADQPIDPRDASTPFGMTNAWEIVEIYQRVYPKARTVPIAGMIAVARAVCPEHHAVFDTRTHVAVPVADLTTLIKGVMDFADLESEDAAIRILNLLPTESETADDTPEGMCERCGGYGLVNIPYEHGFADGMCPVCNGSGDSNSEATR